MNLKKLFCIFGLLVIVLCDVFWKQVVQ